MKRCTGLQMVVSLLVATMFSIFIMTAAVDAKQILSPTPYPTFNVDWNTTVSKGMFVCEIRTAGADIAVVGMVTFSQQGFKLVSLNSSTGGILATGVVGQSADTSNDQLFVSNAERGLVGHIGGDGHYCVSHSATLSRLWCTSSVSVCFSMNQTSLYRDCALAMNSNTLFIADNGTLSAYVAISGRRLWKVTMPNQERSDQTTTGIAATENTVVVSQLGVMSFSAKSGDLNFGFQVGDSFASFSIATRFAFTNEENIAINYNGVSAVLLSPKGIVLQNFTVSNADNIHRNIDYVNVHPITSTLFVKWTSFLSGNSFPKTLAAVTSNNQVQWSSTSDVEISNPHIDVESNTILYTMPKGIYRAELGTGKIVAANENLMDCPMAGQPWVSLDGKTAMVGCHLRSDPIAGTAFGFEMM